VHSGADGSSLVPDLRGLPGVQRDEEGRAGMMEGSGSSSERLSQGHRVRPQAPRVRRWVHLSAPFGLGCLITTGRTRSDGVRDCP
jgi:hypothetical protein